MAEEIKLHQLNFDITHEKMPRELFEKVVDVQANILALRGWIHFIGNRVKGQFEGEKDNLLKIKEIILTTEKFKKPAVKVYFGGLKSIERYTFKRFKVRFASNQLYQLNVEIIHKHMPKDLFEKAIDAYANMLDLRGWVQFVGNRIKGQFEGEMENLFKIQALIETNKKFKEPIVRLVFKTLKDIDDYTSREFKVHSNTECPEYPPKCKAPGQSCCQVKPFREPVQRD